MEILWVLFGLIILLAFTLEAITGFGSIVVALSLGLLFLPIDMILPILVALNIPMTSTLAFKNRHNIDLPLLFKTILPGMLLGTLTGYFAKPYLDEEFLKQALGVLIIWFSGRELYRLYHQFDDRAKPAWLTRFITYFAGITHGLFASGGPLLVYAVAGTKIDKARFRATMVTVWFSMNCLLFTAFLLDGRMQPLLINVVWYLPLLVVAVKLGNYLHDRLNENHFRIGVYTLLFVTGVILIASRYLTQ
ncbi:sulfite exporter TauE/SafE family protein [Microbulbifer agarilyticus]|uniref:sulfite exporter TauE/SafE family protein n=1 Tax=Microbulbifer agarilyticus TaxID=260552 RepID=UPI001C970DB5|nr:sulfite exporter TauE/SafE family protein [Microbulbifer agarilyticus]MBY6189688.1 sulfite exporter TauE/SafE family protein [Microbulbifer agarilyticus]MBY6210992.1 sulfite exporter TauE/SafE family protein [Microbulbifer agarilyticus]